MATGSLLHTSDDLNIGIEAERKQHQELLLQTIYSQGVHLLCNTTRWQKTTRADKASVVEAPNAITGANAASDNTMYDVSAYGTDLVLVSDVNFG